MSCMVLDIYNGFNENYGSLFGLAVAFIICYVSEENLGFDNPFLPETLYHIFNPIDCSFLEDRMLNCKGHLSKSHHVQPDKNWISMFIFKFPANIYPARKHQILYHYLYELQEQDNKAMYLRAICHNCITFIHFQGVNIIVVTVKLYWRFNHSEETCQKLLLEMDAHSFGSPDGTS
ncbi:hypothetical protein M9H77_08175 [Catharanthus roseus]|uniref:Uncharacterized protein n=1 Tax=Catharanthus roseus TaxID=4058 RepID=A0ACC0BX18_CATRO|nr:hypothetical protein M9H77_08175 [Catharanthus roseus]